MLEMVLVPKAIPYILYHFSPHLELELMVILMPIFLLQFQALFPWSVLLLVSPGHVV